MEALFQGLFGGSFRWLQIIVIVTALILKIHKPTFIKSAKTLDLAVILAIASVILPSISGLFSTFSLDFLTSKSKGHGSGFSWVVKIFTIANTIIISFALYNLWISIEAPTTDKEV